MGEQPKPPHEAVDGSYIVPIDSPMPIPPYKNPKGVMLVHLFADSPGDTILIQVPHENGFKNILIDAGVFDPVFFKDYFERFNHSGEGTLVLDHIFITHPHKDHYNHVIDFFDNDYATRETTVWLPHVDQKSHLGETYTATVEQIVLAGATIKKVSDSMGHMPLKIIEFPPGFTVEYLGPTGSYLEKIFKKHGNLNNTSQVLRVKFRDKSLLFPGDAERNLWKDIFRIQGWREEIDNDYLKLAHHGSSNGMYKPSLNRNLSLVGAYATATRHPTQKRNLNKKDFTKVIPREKFRKSLNKNTGLNPANLHSMDHDRFAFFPSQNDAPVSYIYTFTPTPNTKDEATFSAFRLTPSGSNIDLERLPGFQEYEFKGNIYYYSYEPEDPYRDQRLNKSAKEALVLWNHRIQTLFH